MSAHGVRSCLVMTAVTATLGARSVAAQPAPTPVTLEVAVTDADEERYVEGLTAADVRVLEDGQPQVVTSLVRRRRPVSVCVVFDASTSEDRPAKYRIAEAAVGALAASLAPDDEIAALVMRTAPDVRLPLTRAADVTTVDWSDLPHRGWGLDDTLRAALDVLDLARHPRRVVLIVSDGIPGGRQVTLPNVVTTKFRSETSVHAIETVVGLPPDPGRTPMPVLDRRIAKPQLFDSPVRARQPDPALDSVVRDGGGLFQRVGDAGQAEEAVRNIATDLQFEYTVEYTPSRPLAGGFRRVQVELTRRDTLARHRAGYLATSSEVRTAATVVLPPVTPADPPPGKPGVTAASAATAPAPTPRPATAEPRAALRATYQAAVESFRTTRRFAGAQVLVGEWSRDTLASAVTASRSSDPAFAFPAAQFHLEVALDTAPLSPENARYHLELGERLLGALEANTTAEVREFVGRWYATAVSIFLAQTDGPRASDMAGRALDRAAGSARVQFVAGRIEELQALTYDGDNARLDRDRPRLNLERRARLAVAEQVYRRALVLEPTYAQASLHLGRVLLELDHRDEGRRRLESIVTDAVGTPGDRYLASLFLAADYERAGEVERARATLEAIETFAPGRQTSWLALAQLEQRAGRVDRAAAIVAAQLGEPAETDEWWGYRSGGLQTEDLAWLRGRIAR